MGKGNGECMAIKRLFKAYLEDFTNISVLMPKVYFGGKSDVFTLEKGCKKIKLFIENVTDIGEEIKYSCFVQDFIHLGNEYFIRDEYGNTTDLQIGKIVRTYEFDQRFYYKEDDLGFTYCNDYTRFKIWTPTATDLLLVIIDLNNNVIEYAMERDDNGVWIKNVKGDLAGCKYFFKVKNNGEYKDVIDPYGIASSVNCRHSCVIDKNKLEEVNTLKNENFLGYTDAIIYELSVRDFTVDEKSNVKNKGKYLGLAEKNIKTDDGLSVGIDYIKELGITHVQLLPIYDFGGIDEQDTTALYNWGYNPEQFNVPEGSYATDPNNPYSRINELKLMINTFHKNNIGVIMDVVYNHVYDMHEFPFEKLVPGYFFRYDDRGMKSNATGCGNDIASERSMVRKFIIDSVKYWASEYKIDGFRFDLMGILDVETMNIIKREVDKINRKIMLYGEGWNMPTALEERRRAHQGNAYKMEGYGHFNDRYRDLIKGNTFDVYNKGYVMGNFNHLGEMKFLLSGSIAYESTRKYKFFQPMQSINYVECHDNHTLWDKLKLALANEAREKRIKRQLLANAIVLLSQGVPFIHAGQEFLRTKFGVENSYCSPDKINRIDWRRAENNKEYIEYFKNIIKLRKSHRAFSFYETRQIQKHMNFLQEKEGCIGYILKNVNCYGNCSDIMVLFNGLDTTYNLSLPNGKWKVVLSELNFNLDGLSQVEGKYDVSPLSTVVFVK